MIFRWTIGPTNANGLDCLMESIKSFQKFYPNNEYYLFFNQIERKVISRFEKLNLKIIDQNDFNIKINKKCGSLWKFVPNRIDLNKHEVFIDNDLLITKKIKEIDLFIENTNKTLLCQDINRFYGIYENKIKRNIATNAGLIGLPPEFNLNIDYEKTNSWTSYYDEQGFTSLALLNEDYILISLEVMSIVGCKLYSSKTFNPIRSGYHFVGLNHKIKHESWELFKANKIKLI